LKLGILTSSTRQLTTSGSLLASNSTAEPNILTLRPTELSRPASEIRKSGSSSTRKTICCSAVAGIGDECIAAGRGRTPRSEAASSPLGEANIEALMVLSWRASIEDPPFDAIRQSSFFERLSEKTLATLLEVRVGLNSLDGTHGTFLLGCVSCFVERSGLIEATCGRRFLYGYRTFSRSGSYQWMSEQNSNADSRKSSGSNPASSPWDAAVAPTFTTAGSVSRQKKCRRLSAPRLCCCVGSGSTLLCRAPSPGGALGTLR